MEELRGKNAQAKSLIMIFGAENSLLYSEKKKKILLTKYDYLIKCFSKVKLSQKKIVANQ